MLNIKTAVLIDTYDTGTIAEPTRPPVEQQNSFPFKGWSAGDIFKFSREHFDRARQGIVPEHLVILDEQTVKDNTCLLVAPKEGQENKDEMLIVRADFRSSLVLLNLKAMGVGGDGHFENTDSNGVIRLQTSV